MDRTTDTRAPVIREAFPYLCVRGGAQAIEFYTHVFGAVEELRLTDRQGRVGHAELGSRGGPGWAAAGSPHATGYAPGEGSR